MALRLAIETDNAAFDSDKNNEIIRILQKTIKTLDRASYTGRRTASFSEIIHDSNGNAVGSWHLD